MRFFKCSLREGKQARCSSRRELYRVDRLRHTLSWCNARMQYWLVTMDRPWSIVGTDAGNHVFRSLAAKMRGGAAPSVAEGRQLTHDAVKPSHGRGPHPGILRGYRKPDFTVSIIPVHCKLWMRQMFNAWQYKRAAAGAGWRQVAFSLICTR